MMGARRMVDADFGEALWPSLLRTTVLYLLFAELQVLVASNATVQLVNALRYSKPSERDYS